MDSLSFKTLRNTVVATIYIFLVSQVILNGNSIFGEMDKAIGPFVFLLLFSFSAAVVGCLIFGQSIYLFMEGKKKESIQAALYSVGWLGLFTMIGILILIIL